jgi:tetratricopeptide (TPR) repeat protein
MKTAVVIGPQGFGKTQVAKKYVHENFKNYDVVWWFRANQYLKPQFEEFALEVISQVELDLPKSIGELVPEYLARIVKEGIRQKNLKCLIIFDDAQTYPEIEEYLLFSHDKNIHTLITSKNGNFSEAGIKIKPFSRENSLAYMNLLLPEESQSSKDLLADCLDDCPAAIAQSIDYIKNYPGMTIGEYLKKHKESKISILLAKNTHKKLGSSVDEYETDLLAATKINISDLREHSEDAFQLLGFLSLLHRDEIPLTFLEKWVKLKGIKTDVMTLINQINQYSLIEITQSASEKGAYITMQELIQSTVTALIPETDKRRLITDAAQLLKESFSGRSDQNVESILRDNTPLLDTIRLSQEADQISYHTPNLMAIRIRALDVLVGMIRDFPAAEEIMKHLKNDFQNKTIVSNEDEGLYYANMALYSAIKSPDYDKAVSYGLKALALTDEGSGSNDERLRILSNLAQHTALSGLTEDCGKYITLGEEVFESTQSDAYKALFILAKNIYLLDKRNLQEAIELVGKNRELLDQQKFYPSMKYFILNQLAEAQIKNGDFPDAKNTLDEGEKCARDYHGENENNMFFGKLYVMRGMCLSQNSANFDEAKKLMEKGINILDTRFGAPNKHKLQAFAHLQLGNLYHKHKDFMEAKRHYEQSELIFDNILKEKKIDDVCSLYKQLAIFGVDMKDESLTHDYLNKLMMVFGVNHYSTIETASYLDERGIPLPF